MKPHAKATHPGEGGGEGGPVSTGNPQVCPSCVSLLHVSFFSFTAHGTRSPDACAEAQCTRQHWQSSGMPRPLLHLKEQREGKPRIPSVLHRIMFFEKDDITEREYKRSVDK